MYHLFRNRGKQALAAVTILGALFTFGACTSNTGNTNGNSNATANLNANGNSNASATPASATSPLGQREPENYSATITVSGTGQASNRQGSGTLQIDFARRGTDRRWTLNLPAPVGQVTYLEKGNLKYLIIPARNQYVEIRPEALGAEQLPSLMTPSTMIDALKARTDYENQGTETVNGRTAVKYRFAGAKDTGTKAGTVAADSFVYVDEATGLPLRSQINAQASSGATAQVVTETRDINLNPDPTLFELPTSMKQVTTEELKQQVQSFVALLRTLAPMIQQQISGGAAAAPAQPSPRATTNGNANGNANRQ
ncbi:MAG TPA: hypothetical protein VJQ56_14255 [Blastocatellia bacterium]|nr:hypothetical protein [Blastocatellia bacterium]